VARCTDSKAATKKDNVLPEPFWDYATKVKGWSFSDLFLNRAMVDACILDGCL
jgi:hypothetical protein